MRQGGKKMRIQGYADPIYASPCQPVVWRSHAICQEPKDIPILKENWLMRNSVGRQHLSKEMLGS